MPPSPLSAAEDGEDSTGRGFPPMNPVQLGQKVRSAVLQHKRRLSTLTSAVLTKIAGASTSQYDDYCPSPDMESCASAKKRNCAAPPLAPSQQQQQQRAATGGDEEGDAEVPPPLRPGVSAGKLLASKMASAAAEAKIVAAKPAKLVASAASNVERSVKEVTSNVQQGVKDASKINWPKEVRHEIVTAGMTLQQAAKSIVQQVDDEADSVFDAAEQSIGAVADKFRRSVGGAVWGFGGRRTSTVVHDGLQTSAEGDGAVVDAEEDEEHEEGREDGLQTAVTSMGSAVTHVGAQMGAAVASGLGLVEERLFLAESSLLKTGDAVSGALEEGVTTWAKQAGKTFGHAGAAVGETIGQAGAAVGETIDAVEDRMDAVEVAVGDSLRELSDAVGDVGTRLGDVASEMIEGVKDLRTDAAIMALRVEEQLVATSSSFDATVHGLATRVVGALEAAPAIVDPATDAAFAYEAPMQTAMQAQIVLETARPTSDVEDWEADADAALQDV